MVISFKRSHECTATLSAPSPAAGHHQAMPLLETPRHSQASLGQTSVASLFLSPGSWCTRFCLCLRRVYFPACVSSGSSMVGLMATSSKRVYAIRKSLHPEPLSLWQTTANLYLHRRYSNAVLSQSLWGPWVLVHTRFVWAFWASLERMGFDSKHEFVPPTILLGLLLCPWTWGISSQPLQRLLSYCGFSNLGLGVSPQGRSSKVLPPLLTLKMSVSSQPLLLT